jgi:hypothetical protein
MVLLVRTVLSHQGNAAEAALSRRGFCLWRESPVMLLPTEEEIRLFAIFASEENISPPDDLCNQIIPK